MIYVFVVAFVVCFWLLGFSLYSFANMMDKGKTFEERDTLFRFKLWWWKYFNFRQCRKRLEVNKGNVVALYCVRRRLHWGRCKTYQGKEF